MAKLTKRFIDSLTIPAERERVYWDDELKGFGIRLRSSGRRTFIVQFRNLQARTRKLTLGAYGKLTPDEARKLARQILADVSKGNDPVNTRVEERHALTIEKLGERYMAEHAEPKKKPASIARDRQLLERFIKPSLGKITVKGIKREDIVKFHHAMRNTPIQANRTFALLSKMFSLAEKWGLRPDGSNPCRHVERYKERKRERFLSGDELARLGTALSEAEKTEAPSAILAIRLLLFSGARVSEILTLKWPNVHIDERVLILPESKTGTKRIPLSGPALKALINALHLSGNPYVCFGKTPGGHLVGLHRIWARIRNKAGLEDVRLHDLRHSFASVAAAAGMGLPIIGALLGHSQPTSTARYAHLAMDPLIAASDEVAKRIDEAIRKEPKKAKVIELRNKQ